MVKTKTVQQLVIELDHEVSLESNLLNRYARLPANRRQEWLRGLLLQGFRDEIRVLSGVQASARRHPMMAFTRRISRQALPPVDTGDQETMATKVQAAIPTATGKPFTALGKVIG
jgi:hypothetical protein